MGIYRSLRSCRREDIYWLQPEFGGRRIYLCWYTRVGNFGQHYLHKTLLGVINEKASTS